MNKGLYFSSPRKITLTLLNLVIVGIGAVLVCLSSLITLNYYLTNSLSVALVSTSPEKPFMITPATPVFRAPLIISSFCFFFFFLI